MEPPFFLRARTSYHAALIDSGVLCLTSRSKGRNPEKPKSTLPDQFPSNADGSNRASILIAQSIYDQVRTEAITGPRLAGQISGSKFELITKAFVKSTFEHLGSLRPGRWTYSRKNIFELSQYQHLAALSKAGRDHPEIRVLLGNDYVIAPDIVISREPESDEDLNERENLVDANIATRATLRKSNNPVAILHASISCKWTLRSDRAQNARSEALNLIRNRKGHLPHIVVVTGEPTPSRLSSLALGTGDLDCVYHFALPELIKAVNTLKNESEAKSILATMTEGKRLKDISDLPLDLAV